MTHRRLFSSNHRTMAAQPAGDVEWFDTAGSEAVKCNGNLEYRRNNIMESSGEHHLSIEDHIHSILDLLSDGVYISDRNGLTLAVNTMYERLTGLEREKLIGRHVEVLTREYSFDTILNPRIVKTGKPATSIQTNHKDKKLLLTGFPVFDAGGEVALVVTFVRDITLLSQLKDQIASQQDLIEKYRSNVEYLNEARIHKSPIVAKSPEMNALMAHMDNVAPTDATILLQGETGVGKDVVARYIHVVSQRHGRPFFKVDCPSIPETLIESELFGYAPGAFSGAHSKGKIGYFEIADKGTLFLDEIGELPLAMQVKLLRVLQDHEILRLGSTKPKKVDVRIIAATNRDLEEEVRKGRFRSDLFYRIRVSVLTIPPLRERKDDILPLASHFLQQHSTHYNKRVSLGPGVERVFLGYRWPGNVRELENLVQSLVIGAQGGCIEISDLPPAMVSQAMESGEAALQRLKIADGEIVKGGQSKGLSPIRQFGMDGLSLKEIMSDIERQILEDALKEQGSVSGVAKRFRIDRSTIFRKLRKC